MLQALSGNSIIMQSLMSAVPQNKHVSCFRAVGGNTKLLCTAPQASVIAYLLEPDCSAQCVSLHVCASVCVRVCLSVSSRLHIAQLMWTTAVVITCMLSPPPPPPTLCSTELKNYEPHTRKDTPCEAPLWPGECVLCANDELLICDVHYSSRRCLRRAT